MTEHATHCSVVQFIGGEKFLNNAMPCTCGFRAERAQAAARMQKRWLPPLKMTDEEFLRSNGIKPEED